MSHLEDRIEQLSKLPFRAIAAFALRCALRVQDLCTPDKAAAVSDAIRIAEDYVQGNDVQREVANQAQRAAGSDTDDAACAASAAADVVWAALIETRPDRVGAAAYAAAEAEGYARTAAVTAALKAAEAAEGSARTADEVTAARNAVAETAGAAFRRKADEDISELLAMVREGRPPKDLIDSPA
jgi:hypothetical protein